MRITHALFDHIAPRMGASAATTYVYLRERGMSAASALSVARAQIACLGVGYGGGIDAIPYRKAYRAGRIMARG